MESLYKKSSALYREAYDILENEVYKLRVYVVPKDIADSPLVERGDDCYEIHSLHVYGDTVHFRAYSPEWSDAIERIVEDEICELALEDLCLLADLIRGIK